MSDDTRAREHALIEQAAEEMFNQHHGPTAACRTWKSVDEREHIYWRSKARIGFKYGKQAGRRETWLAAAEDVNNVIHEFLCTGNAVPAELLSSLQAAVKRCRAKATDTAGEGRDKVDGAD